MDILDLDNIKRKWTLKGYLSKASLTNKSSLHIKARKILHQLFPTVQILEEVSIPINAKETLYLDFYIPLLKTCVEVHGEQHYMFTPFYHATKLHFLKAQKRDRQKKEWCDKNTISYIELPYSLTEQEWIDRINEH